MELAVDDCKLMTRKNHIIEIRVGFLAESIYDGIGDGAESDVGMIDSGWVLR